jgi:hypothetical protein
MRNVHQDVIDARAQGKPRADLYQLHFAQGTLYTTDAPFDISSGGITYISSGDVLKITELTTKVRLVNVNKSITLSGVDQALVSIILNESQTNRTFTQHTAYLNEDYTIIQTPYLEWQGIMTSIKSSGNPEKPTIVINTSTIFDDFDRRVNRTTTLASQQSHFPLCTGMRYASETTEEIKWGVK